MSSHETDAPDAAGPVSEPPVEKTADVLVGTKLLNRYHVKEKLGEGGMGAVYKATHITLEKDVALKVLHGEYARKPELVQRFLQEAKAASKIRHPNVIDITDFGTTPQGWVFFAMELLNGQDLHELLEEARLAGQRLRWERTCDIFLQVCSALQAAHERGIVHRDLKPENIFLIDHPSQNDFVKLLDFGIAKVSQEEEGGRKLTKTGMLFGTPEYMSPEQAKGEKVDNRVDIYAMGCILYQMVTGRTPFQAENFMSVLTKHLTESPAPIAASSMDEIGAPHEIGRVLAVALAKNRDERYSTIDEMAEVIRGVDRGESVTSIRRAVGRSRKGLWLGIGAVAIVAAVGAFVAFSGGENEASTKQGAIAGEQTPSEVDIVITSEPDGARIVNVATGAVIGETPYQTKMPYSEETTEYRLELDGHLPRKIRFAPSEKRVINWGLVPEAGSSSAISSAISSAASVTETPPNPTSSASSRRSKSSRSSRIVKSSSSAMSKASSSVGTPDWVKKVDLDDKPKSSASSKAD